MEKEDDIGGVLIEWGGAHQKVNILYVLKTVKPRITLLNYYFSIPYLLVSTKKDTRFYS